MTLRELINSVDSELYSDNALYQMLRETKPEYGASRHISKAKAMNFVSSSLYCLLYTRRGSNPGHPD